MSWWASWREGVQRLGSRAATSESTPAEPVAAVPAVRTGPAVRTVPSWPDAAAVQRSLSEPIRPVAPLDTFTGALATQRNPSFLAPLSHQVDPGVGGVVDGLADLTPTGPRTYAPATDLTAGSALSAPGGTPPPVQRTWGNSLSPEPDVVPMERPDVDGAGQVGQSDAGLVGRGTSDAPVSVAAPAPDHTASAPDHTAPAPDHTAPAPDHTASVLPVPALAGGHGPTRQRTAQPPREPADGPHSQPAALRPDPAAPFPDPAAAFPDPAAADRTATPAPLIQRLDGSPVDPTGPPAARVPPPGRTGELLVAPASASPAGASRAASSTFIPGFPSVQRRLVAVPDRPAQRVPEPDHPTLELPVLRLIDSPASDAVVADPSPAPDDTHGADGGGSDLMGAGPALMAAGIGAPEAPLSGFAAAISALNAPDQGSDGPGTSDVTDATAVPAPTAGTTDPPAASSSRLPAASQPAVQRSTGDPSLSGQTGRPYGPPEPAWAGWPALPVRRPAPESPISNPLRSLSMDEPGSLGAPTVSRRVEPDRPSLASAPAQLIGATPLLVQRQAASAAAVAPAVQPVSFIEPSGPTGRPRSQPAEPPAVQLALPETHRFAPVETSVVAPAPESHRAAAGPTPAAAPATPVSHRWASVDTGLTAQRMVSVAPGPAVSGWTRPAGPKSPGPGPAAPAADPDLAWSLPTSVDGVPVGSDPSAPGGERRTELDGAAASSYEVVQLSALGQPTTPATHPAPSVQRRPASVGPAVSPVATTPPNRLESPHGPGSDSSSGVGPVHTVTAHSSPPVSFASMFSGAGGPAETGYTSVQLLPEDPPPAEAAPPVESVSAPPALSAAPTAAGAAPAAPAATSDLDELARRLYEPLSARIRAELWLDRERSGLMADVRP